MAHERQLTLLLSIPVLTVLVFIGSVPLLWPFMSKYEGSVLPVVENVNITQIKQSENGVFVDVSFDKVRSCEFIGISWYDSLGDRSPVIFEAEARGEEGEIPETRPVMEDQRAGPWKLIGIDNLDGSMAIVSHRCHPLWITYTRFFP